MEEENKNPNPQEEPKEETPKEAHPLMEKSKEDAKNPFETPKPEPKEDNSKQIEELQTQIRELETQNLGLIVALEVGLDVKNADAVLKLADLSTVHDKNGNLNKNSLRVAINKVLEEYPALKPNNRPSGIVIGGYGNGSQSPQVQKQEKPIAQKRWNRFN